MMWQQHPPNRMTATSTSPSASYIGRPSEITAVSPTLLRYIEDGLTLQDAATGVGITYRTLRRWIERGETEIDRVENSERKLNIRKKHRPYVDFVIQYRDAQRVRRQNLHNAATLVAQGFYELEETQTKTVTQNGAVVQEEKIVKKKTVAPNGTLALRLLQYDDQVNGNGEPEEDNSETVLFSEVIAALQKAERMEVAHV